LLHFAVSVVTCGIALQEVPQTRRRKNTRVRHNEAAMKTVQLLGTAIFLKWELLNHLMGELLHQSWKPHLNTVKILAPGVETWALS